MKKIFIVEDEPDIVNLVAHNLRKEKFEVSIFYDGESFLKALEDDLPDLVVLDLMLPGIDGLEVCKIMRSNEKTQPIPIVILTAKGSEVDIVLGLELGADDYMVKPFSVRELIARVKAVLRRSEMPQKDNLIVFEGLSIDLEKFQAKIDGVPIDLTYSEFKTLQMLILKPGRVYTRQQIIDGIWDDYRVVTSKTVDVHITHLRKKLGKYGDFIKTVRGVGYKFEA
ncbi:response regulator transcription factor [Candidatus Poribacteria bacterium]|nr:response regulator transcription factor [Candidatus Poribacteria bacterium]